MAPFNKSSQNSLRMILSFKAPSSLNELNRVLNNISVLANISKRAIFPTPHSDKSCVFYTINTEHFIFLNTYKS